MSYISYKHNLYELDTSKLTETVLEELNKANIKLKKSKGKVYAVNPNKKQLDFLARRQLLQGVAVIYDKDELSFKVIPKPAAILCELAGTCRIIKTFPNYKEAWKYLEEKLGTKIE